VLTYPPTRSPVARRRAKPGELTLAIAGPATVFHLGFEKINVRRRST
jgi:hypothetical protein